MLIRLTILFFLIFGGILPTFANGISLEQLSGTKQWRHLLHYHQTGLFSQDQSQADDPDFFFSEHGAADPLAELQATIEQFSREDQQGLAARCRFPARRIWLESQLNRQFPPSSCPDFDTWYSKIDPGGLTLIFPAAYLNSPSSMFGHTLIRIDRKNGTNSLLDYSVNYAANADPEDNELVFSYKGLTGGYPGVFSILPYYQKVKEYSFLESRDVWEYTIDIEAAELKQFLRHVWEIKSVHFDYYFFTENCSYHLLTLLDASSERFDFSRHFTLHAIPSDTVKVLASHGVLKDAVFRPSTQTRMEHMRAQLDQDDRDQAKQLVETSEDISRSLASYESKERAQILELAYQYSRYLSVRKKEGSEALNKRSIALLSARSKIDTEQAFSAPRQPDYRDDEGHDSQRMGLSYGNDGFAPYFDLALRMAYHDHLDPLPGYIPGAKLEMFNLRMRQYVERSSGPRLESLRLLDISSLSPRNELLTPVSWRVSTGLKRSEAYPDDLMPFLEGGGGFSWRVAGHLVSTVLATEIATDSDINKGFQFLARPELSILNQRANWSYKLEYHLMEGLLGSGISGHVTKIGAGINLIPNWQLRIDASYLNFNDPIDRSDQEFVQGSGTLLYYF